MGRRADVPRQPKGISFPQLGDKWYVFRAGRNRIGPFDSEQEARDAAARHFARGRKKNT